MALVVLADKGAVFRCSEEIYRAMNTSNEAGDEVCH